MGRGRRDAGAHSRRSSLVRGSNERNEEAMLTVPALKIGQFNQDFFLLKLVAADVEWLDVEVVVCRRGDRDRRQIRGSARLSAYEVER